MTKCRLLSLTLAVVLAVSSCTEDSSVDWSEIETAFHEQATIKFLHSASHEEQAALAEEFCATQLADVTAAELLEGVRSACAELDTKVKPDDYSRPTEAQMEVWNYTDLIRRLYPILAGEHGQEAYLALLKSMSDKQTPDVLTRELITMALSRDSSPDTFFRAGTLRNRGALLEAYRSVYLDSAEALHLRQEALRKAETVLVSTHDAILSADSNVEEARRKTGKLAGFGDVPGGKVELTEETREKMEPVNADFVLFANDLEVILKNAEEPKELLRLAASHISRAKNSRRWSCQERLEELYRMFPFERYQKKLPSQLTVEKLLKDRDKLIKEQEARIAEGKKKHRDYSGPRTYKERIIQEISEQIRKEQQDLAPSERYSEEETKRMALERYKEQIEQKLKEAQALQDAAAEKELREKKGGSGQIGKGKERQRGDLE